MYIATSAIGLVKDAGPLLWKCIKFQIRTRSYAEECTNQKTELESRYDGVLADLQTQKRPIGMVATREVADWLEKAKNAIEADEGDDQVNKCGCFCNVRRSRHFVQRTKDLKAIYDKGAAYRVPGVDLVQEDASKLKDHFMGEFRKICGSLRDCLKDIESTLDEQMSPEKIERDAVRHWREEVGKKLETAQAEVNGGGCLSDDSVIAKLLQEKIGELEKLHGEGRRFIGANLVNDNFLVIKEQRLSKFEEAKRSLRLRKEVIESTLKNQLCFGKVVKGEVRDWLEKVEKLVQAADEEIIKGGCLSPALLVPLLEDKIGVLDELFVTGGRYTNDRESLVTDDPLKMKGVTLEVEKCYGRETALVEIPKYLKGDQVTRIALCGMGGIGKTTVLKHINDLFLKDSKFDKVVWVTVSSKFDVSHIQNVISKQLTREPLEEEDPIVRKGMISAMLREGKHLLLLDDLWDAFFAEKVGIPTDTASFADKCFKVVLTTRSKVVARTMGCEQVIDLKPLPHEEALQLFLDKVGAAVLSSNREIKPNLESIVKQIVEKCDGLPLAIIAVAGTMRGMADHQGSWEMALEKLQDGRGVVEEGERDPKEILKFSYDQLKDKSVKDCFLHCALYPEDYLIPKAELIKYLIQEGILHQKKTRHKMFLEGHQILRKLQDNYLLECIKDEYREEKSQELGYDVSEDFEMVKMHDLLREMALDIMRKSPRFFVQDGVLEKEEALTADDVQKVSFTCMEEFPLAMTSLKYSKLTTLLMRDNSIVTIPESLFMQMPGLKILDLSRNKRLSSLPDSTSDLLNLTTLSLEDCWELTKVPSLSKCRALTMLNLSNSRVEEVPDGMEMLVNLQYFRFEGTNIKQLPDGILAKLLNLQVLSGNWMAAEEVKTLRKLEYLGGTIDGSLEKMYMTLKFMHSQVKQLFEKELHLPAYCSMSKAGGKINVVLPGGKLVCSLEFPFHTESIDFKCLSSTLSFQSLEIYRLFNVGGIVKGGFYPFQTLQVLELYDIENLTSVFDEEALRLSAPSAASIVVFPLKRITVSECDKLKKLFSLAWIGYFQNLEFVELQNNDSLEEIISSSSEEAAPEKITLPKLKTLEMSLLPALKRICGDNSVLICESLESLNVALCGELVRISLYPSLPNLESISVIRCRQLVEIIPSTSEEEPLQKLALPKLKEMILRSLSALESICDANSVLLCDSLENLEIIRCDKLKRIPLFLPQLDDAQPSASLSICEIYSQSREYWESCEWSQPNAKDILLPKCKFLH